jgi:membrane protease YdiL (CAAX protease family)
MQNSKIRPDSAFKSIPSATALAGAALAAFIPPLVTWYLLYPLAEYNNLTLNIALALTPLVAVGIIIVLRLRPFSLGLSLGRLARAGLLITLGYGLVVLLGFLVNNLTVTQLPLLRSSYSLGAWVNGWLLTGLGEELLFSGVLFSLLAARLPRRRWLAVLGVAVLFALWHLPGYLAQGRLGGDLAGRLALNAVSWLFFGTVYALSGNLWLAAFTHASTDYALVPLVTSSPLLGLVFMFFIVFASWALRQGRFQLPFKLKLAGRPG